MALPVTITGISTAVAPVGPFMVSTSIGTIYAIATTMATAVAWGSNTANSRVYQTFLTGANDLTITSVTFALNKTASPTDNITVDIYLLDTGTNLPIGSSLGTSTARAGSTLTTSAVRYAFAFTTPVSIAPNTKYAAVLSRSGAVDSVNFYGNYRNATANTDATQTSGFYNSSTVVWSTSATDYDLTVTGSKSTASYYFFGRDGTTATTLQAYKSTAPDTSWASITTKTGFTTAILNIAGYQVGNTIHLVVNDGTVSTSMATKYLSFNAATDTFLATIETVAAAGVVTGTATAGWGASLVVRSNGNAVIFYNGAVVTSRARLYYRERTGVNTYGTATRVDDNGTTDNTTPVAVLGATNRVHFFWSIGTTSTGYRTLSAANALPTGASSTSMVAPGDGVSYDRSGTIKVVITSNGNGAQTTARFDSADAPTVTFANQSIADATIPHRIGVNTSNDDVTIAYRSSADSDLYAIKSTDDGATFGAPASLFVGTVANADTSVSRSSSGSMYTRGSSDVIGYIVNDNGTLKYNEYSISAGVTNYTLTALAATVTVAGQSAILARSHDLNVNAAAITIAGQSVTLTKGVAVTHYTLTAQPGAAAISGQSAALRSDRRMPAVAGAIAIAGQPVTLRYTHALQAGAATLTVAAQSVTLRDSRKLVATASAVTAAGQGVTLRYAHIVKAGAGAAVLNGQSVSLTYSGAGKLLSALPGTATIAGQSVTLTRTTAAIHYTLTAQPGAVTSVAQPIVMRYSHKLLATAGAVTPAGQGATLRYSHKLLAAVGAATINGQPVALRHGHAGQAVAGAVVINGRSVGLNWSAEGLKLSALPAAVAIAGRPITMRYGHRTLALAAAVAVAGQPVALRRNRNIAVAPGAVALSGRSVTLRYTVRMQAGIAAIVAAGQGVNLTYRKAGLAITALPASVTMAGEPILLVRGRDVRLEVQPGAMTATGQEVDFWRTYAPPPILRAETMKMGRVVYLRRW
jgi:hypothetical protein